MSGERRGRGKETLLLLTVAAFSLGVAELALRAWWSGPSLVRDPSRPFLLHPDPRYVPGVNGPARFEPSVQGFRGDVVTEGHVNRIIALGGSTTEGAVLDTDEAWPALLQGALGSALDRRVWIGNAGMSGISSRHHLAQIGELLDQVPRVEIVLLLAGVNDLLRALRQTDAADDWYDDTRERVRVHYEAFGVPARPRFGPWWERTELVHTIRRARASWRMREPPDFIDVDDGRQYDAARQLRAAGVKVDELPDLSVALATYRHNLERVVAQAESRRTRVVLATHPAMWSADLAPHLDSLLHFGAKDPMRPPLGTGYYSTAALARGLAAFNAATLAVCADHRLDCLDLAPLLPSDTTVFYDDVHFNESGARAVAAELALFLTPLLENTAP